MKYFWGILCLILVGFASAQQKKTVEANYISKPLTIDAVLDEEIYKTAQPATNFVQLQPYNGKPSFQPTDAYYFYDESAVYVGAMLYDSQPDSIFNYLTQRDNIGMSDYFGVYIDPYNSGQVAYGFFTTPSGVQTDIKASKSDGDMEDENWNAVWECKARITDKGWVVEMRIPFSALRFSEKSSNTWGLNMFRNIRRYNSNNSWSLIDRTMSGFIHQQGQLSGIKNIKPPVRLSFSPYLAAYYEPNGKGDSKLLYKGGLDVKYGINDAFTLDMMLIPDFGQIQSDDQKLNLSPYELYYDEKRQFFTEGTEMFQRAGIFYSRRIGSAPKFSAEKYLDTNETVKYNPGETQLINATKVSGRTNKGLGLGILNAMSLESSAVLIDNNTQNQREVVVQPFTNYNVVVMDKSLKNNSYISLVNTNMAMAGSVFHANVTATEFEFRDKTKTYALKGKGGISTRGDSISENGFFANLGFEKNKGKFFFGANQKIYSDKYNPNDLGYLQRNNQVSTEAWLFYQIINPFWIFNEVKGDVWWNYNRMYNPNTLFDKEMGYDLSARFKNNYFVGVEGKIISQQFDYYEPRIPGRFYLNPNQLQLEVAVNTDYRKWLNFNFEYENILQPEINHQTHYLGTQANIRAGQQLNIEYGINFGLTKNERGFASYNATTNDIIFAKRNVNTIINTLESTYVINNKSGLSLRARHYWSGVENKSYFMLQNNGTLLIDNNFSENLNQNYNAFTVDMVYRWIFAPGSELSLAWKTLSYSNDNAPEKNYFANLNKSWQNQTSSLSLKVLYYIDYNNLKKKSST